MKSSCTSSRSCRTRRRDFGFVGTARARAHAQAERDVLEDRHVPEQRVVLEHEADAAVARVARRGVFPVEQHGPRVGRLQPRDDPQHRRLAGAGRPEQRDELARCDPEADVVERDEAAEGLPQTPDFDSHAMTSTASPSGVRARLADAPFHERLQHQRHEREARQQRRDRKRRLCVVFVVQNLDVQRQGIGDAADVARHDRHGAELPHRARVGEDDAVQQPPLDVRQRHADEHLQPAGAEHARRLFFLGAGRFHDRDDLARHERKRHEDRREHDARAPRTRPGTHGRAPRDRAIPGVRRAARTPGRRSPARRRTADR